MDDPIEPDVFLWLVLSGLVAHLALLAWLCRACWASCECRKGATPNKRTREGRIHAGKRWVEGDLGIHMGTMTNFSRETQGENILASLLRRR